MKKLILSALAASLVASPLAASVADAQTRTTVVRERPNGTVVTKTTTRDWRAGQRFDRRYAPGYRRVVDYRTYRLTAPRRGFYWARSGRDAILIRPNGTIVEVRRSIFR